MKNSTHKKNFIVKKLRYEYNTNPIINLKKYFNELEIALLRKFEIEIDNKLYTEREFDEINEKLLRYYEHSENGEILQTDFLTQKSIDKSELDSILNKFNKIALDYKL